MNFLNCLSLGIVDNGYYVRYLHRSTIDLRTVTRHDYSEIFLGRLFEIRGYLNFIMPRSGLFEGEMLYIKLISGRQIDTNLWNKYT